MDVNTYAIKNPSGIISPALIFYKDQIEKNTRKIIEIAGGAERLWPHVKTHKSADVVKLQMSMGISRFKSATIAEAEMLSDLNVAHIVLAHPLVGPNIQRFVNLSKARPKSKLYAIGDDYGMLKALSDAAIQGGIVVPVLLDVNMGMNRTGVPIEKMQDLYEKAAALEGIALQGLHCYDGHHHDSDAKTRQQQVDAVDEKIQGIVHALRQKGLACDIIIAGGTPSFPCHTRQEGWFLSPGTVFINDMNYYSAIKDLDMLPAAALLTRVISHPNTGLFTLDLGYKGIAADPPVRGTIVGLEFAQIVMQNEEHWVFSLPEDKMDQLPPIGSELYVIPSHICPTTALYPSILVAQNGEITGEWPVTARNRKITF